jgi:hypothetical protein
MKKKVPSEKEIASKHGVSVKYVIRQAEIGSTVEREHTTSHEEAYGIALQHIAEFPDYYKHLLAMEKQLKKKWNDSKRTVKEESEEKRYCPLCKKEETKSQCSYGPSAWEMSSTKISVEEDHKEIASGEKVDDEGYMANLELDQIERSVQILRKLITKPDQQLPAWVQSKITRAADFIDTAAEYLSSDEEVSEGVVSDLVDRVKGRKVVGRTGSGGKIYQSTRPQKSTAKYVSSSTTKKKPTETKKSNSIDHDDPWLKSSSGAEKKAHYRQLRGEELNKSFEQFLSEMTEELSPAEQARLKKREELKTKGKVSTSNMRSTAKDNPDRPSPLKLLKKKREIDESATWTKKEGQNKNGGLNEKGRKSYEAENPGSDLKAPSKEVGNPRRKSFCARMKGMKSKLTSKKTASDPDSRINKSLRAWNC